MKTSILNNETRVNEKYVLLLACFTFGFNPVQDVFLYILRSYVTISKDYLFTYIPYLAIFFMALKAIVRRINWDSIALVFFFLIFYLASICFYGTEPEDSLYLGAEIMLSVSCYIVARSINDFAKFKAYLNITAMIVGISSFLLLFVFKMSEEESYSQYYGYMSLPAGIISASVLSEKFRFTHLLNLILSLLVILYSGARGPFVCFSLFVVIKFLLINGISRRKRITILTVVCTVIAVFVFFFQDILIFLTKIGEIKGYSLRLLTFMSDESLLIDQGRDALRQYSIQLLTENPLTGVGIYNDRILLANHFRDSLSEVAGSYPHNIFIEVLLQFGLIAGSLMIIWLLWIIYRGILKNKNKDTKDIVVIFLAIGFFPLFFSGSYLQFGLFFLFLGLSVNALRNARITD